MNKTFCIISNNCWGAEVYIAAGLQYNTPFVGLLVPPMCFVKLCNNLNEYLSKELVFIKESKYADYHKIDYPLAMLGDVEIHFMHYKDEAEATDKWKRRIERMPKDATSLFVKGDDRELHDWASYAEGWNKIPYRKIFFSRANNTAVDDLVWFYEFENKPTLPDGKRLYKVSRKYISISNWLDNKPYKRPKIATQALNIAANIYKKVLK